MNNFQIFNKFIRPYEVPHLYKYRSFSSKGIRELFEEQKIFLPSSAKLNDPFDCHPTANIDESDDDKQNYLMSILLEREPEASKERIQSFLKQKTETVKNKAWQQKLLNKNTADIGIYSLSEINDSLLMWPYYSDSHRGFCLEFDSSIISTLFWGSLKVHYQDDYPTVNLMHMNTFENLMPSVLYKSLDWAHEAERRIVMTPQEGGVGWYHFPAELLTGVIFGNRIKSTDEKKLLAYIENYPSKIEKYKVELTTKKYGINVVPNET